MQCTLCGTVTNSLIKVDDKYACTKCFLKKR